MDNLKFCLLPVYIPYSIIYFVTLSAVEAFFREYVSTVCLPTEAGAQHDKIYHLPHINALKNNQKETVTLSAVEE